MLRSLVYYAAMSIDGFIADPAGDFSAFRHDPALLSELFSRYPETCPIHAREALGVSAAPRRFDTVVMGRRTHEPALDLGLPDGAYPHLAQYVVTHQTLPASSNVHRVSADPVGFVAGLKEQPGRDIWLCGGGELAAQLLDLIDEIQVKVNPILLGDGVPLVRGWHGPRPFTLAESDHLPGGVIFNTYQRPRALA